MFAYLDSHPSPHFPDNCPSNFCVQLAETVRFDKAVYIALREVYIPALPNGDMVYICCHLCEDSYIGSQKQNILRNYFPPATPGPMLYTGQEAYYIGLRQREISQIRIYILNKDLSPISLSEPHTFCTLHIMQQIYDE